MPFNQPDLETLVERQRADLKSRLELEGTVARRSQAEILAQAQAGGFHALYGAMDKLALNLFVDTADRDTLIRIGSFYGFSPDPATFAGGNVTATGTDTTLIPQGTAFVYDGGDGGVSQRYLSTADATISGGTALVPLQAEVAGEAGNIPVTIGFENQTLQIESPIAGVDDTVTVATGGITGGTDEQSTESFRAELQTFFASEPAGGSDDDYIKWSLEVPGVTRVWVFGNTDDAGDPSLGEVQVLFVRDNDTPSIIPDAGEIAAVQAKLDSERPTTADVTAAAPDEVVLPYTLQIFPDTAENRAAVEAELDDLHRTQAEAGDGAGRGTIFLSQVYTAVGRAPLENFVVTAPVADVVPDIFELLTRGTVTWV